MAKYTAQLESVAAVAVNTGFAWLMAVANTGFTLTRVTLGVRASTSAVTDMQAVVGLNRVTTAGTTPTNGPVPTLVDQDRPANQALWVSAFATPPTTTTDDMVRIALNTKSTVDLPYWLIQNKGTAGGFAFINRDNALPASTQYVLTVEWDE
jgi:hypothetical protein